VQKGSCQTLANCSKGSISTTWLSKFIERLKRLIKLGMGFFSFETTWRTLHGYEMMNKLRKGQIRGFEKRNSMKQATFIASLFGVAI
jgi:hypothetical protein